MNITMWAVRHVPTGHYIPNFPTGQRRGGSFLEPQPIEKVQKRGLRLFCSKNGARSFIIQWCRGKHVCIDHEDGAVRIMPVPTRVWEEMEIVEVRLEAP